MCPRLVEIRSVTSEIRRRKKNEKTTAVKYKPSGIAMPCGLIKICNAPVSKVEYDALVQDINE